MRYLIKIGSAQISKNHKIDYAWLTKKVAEFSQLIAEGHEVIIISSGAVAAGMEIRGVADRPKDVTHLQMLSGQGQVKLIKFYADEFIKYENYVGQVLLTHHNFSSEQEASNIASILDSYVKEGVVPIINENDMINKEELCYERSFTDNDILAALVGKTVKADCVILLTDVDGLYTKDPKSYKDGEEKEIIAEVKDIDDSIFKMASKKTNSLGLGGMYSKVQAASMLKECGIDTVVANGQYSVIDILNNCAPSTRFKV